MVQVLAARVQTGISEHELPPVPAPPVPIPPAPPVAAPPAPPLVAPPVAAPPAPPLVAPPVLAPPVPAPPVPRPPVPAPPVPRPPVPVAPPARPPVPEAPPVPPDDPPHPATVRATTAKSEVKRFEDNFKLDTLGLPGKVFPAVAVSRDRGLLSTSTMLFFQEGCLFPVFRRSATVLDGVFGCRISQKGRRRTDRDRRRTRFRSSRVE